MKAHSNQWNVNQRLNVLFALDVFPVNAAGRTSHACLIATWLLTPS
ncbi:hypothetical protein [Photobacterium swingsii]|nr:hypothetical protein [Photobacterium swingsii]